MMKKYFLAQPLDLTLKKHQIYHLHSVVNASIQYLLDGIQKICFLGVDASYCQAVEEITTRDLTVKNNDDPNHFDPRYLVMVVATIIPMLNR